MDASFLFPPRGSQLPNFIRRSTKCLDLLTHFAVPVLYFKKYPLDFIFNYVYVSIYVDVHACMHIYIHGCDLLTRVCVCIITHECRSAQRPEALDPTGAKVTNGC